jgi:hypothetical protein
MEYYLLSRSHYLIFISGKLCQLIVFFRVDVVGIDDKRYV